MSVYFVNSTCRTFAADRWCVIENGNRDNEVDVDSPANIGNVNNPNLSEAHQALQSFWPRVTEEIRKIGQLDIKTQALPLARIKKIMKLDEDVKMISAEAPMLFSKAAELFIHELTLRAWVHTEDNKRRTLQRNDIAMAITKYDQFDFLIDIVPRDEVKPAGSRSGSDNRTSMNPDQVHYYFQLAQQHQAALQQTTANANGGQPAPAPAQTIQVVQPSTGQLQAITVANPEQAGTTALSTGTSNVTTTSQPQVVHLQTTAGAQPQATNTGGLQLLQQLVTPSGEVQHIPIQLTPAQLQMIRMQLQGGATQPIILQTQSHPQIIQVSQQNAGPTPVFLSQASAVTTTESE